MRHAQGIHNVAGEIDHSAYSSEDYFDAHITPLGWQQVYLFCSGFNALAKDADLISMAGGSSTEPCSRNSTLKQS